MVAIFYFIYFDHFVSLRSLHFIFFHYVGAFGFGSWLSRLLGNYLVQNPSVSFVRLRMRGLGSL